MWCAGVEITSESMCVLIGPIVSNALWLLYEDTNCCIHEVCTPVILITDFFTNGWKMMIDFVGC